MSTRSIIAEPYGDGFRGRYCHSDGYPTWNGEQLHAIVQRDGVERARQVVIHENTYWSSISAGHAGPSYNVENDTRFVDVASYGVAGPGQDVAPDEFITEHADWGTEYTYILADSGLWCFDAYDPNHIPVIVKYTAIDVCWGSVEAQLSKQSAA